MTPRSPDRNTETEESTGLVERVRRAWASVVEGPTAAPSAVVAAISGGGDSVALLLLLHEIAAEAGFRLVAAHLDHGTRGSEAEADGAFVADLADRLGWACERGRWSPERPGHFEEDARRARYAWLGSVASRHGAGAIAVGHTRDDQAETILHRIVRGTGLKGLAGMPRRRPLRRDAAAGVFLARPLLDCSRDELRAFLRSRGQTWREDPSNDDRSRARARVRHELLPMLAAGYNPRVVEALARLGELAGAGLAGQGPEVEAVATRAVVALGPLALVLNRDVLREMPDGPARAEALRMIWRRAGWPERAMTAAHWLGLAHLCDAPAPAARTLPGAIAARVDGDLLRLERAGLAPPAIEPTPSRLPVPGAVAWNGGHIVATLDGEGDERIDLDALVLHEGPSLEVRAPRAGDRFAPLGLGGRTTPLADVLRSSRRSSREGRRLVPVVCDRTGIVWVAGHRIADRVRRVETTRRLLGLSWRPGAGAGAGLAIDRPGGPS
jgi:tRNA(Ile)-lysidine synthase